MIPPKVICEITAERIQTRIGEIASEIDAWALGQPIIAIGVLKGSFIFYSDLVRKIKSPVCCEFLGISSSEGGETRSGEMTLNLDTSVEIAGQNVLLVDELVNTGLTLAYLQRLFKARLAKSVKTVVLATKQKRSVIPLSVDYVGFTLDERYFVGFGMDYQGWFRELPYLGTIHL